MFFRGLIALVASAAAFSTPAAPAGPLAAAPRPATVNLHAEFARLAGHVTHGPIAGVVPARGSRAAAAPARAAAACAEPGCPLTYHGGPVQRSPRVYLVLWGDWSGPAASTAESFLVSLYQGLGAAPRDTWSAITAQYAAPVSGAVLAASVNDTSAPPDPVTGNDLAAEAAAYAAYFGVTDLTDAQVVIASAPGTCFADNFAGSCGTPSDSGGYCAWHSSATTTAGNLPFTNLPFQLDAQYACGENWVNLGYFGEFDGFTTVPGHEYAETITDPFPDTGWDDTADSVSGGEIADKCAWGGAAFGVIDPAGDVSLSTGTFAMQSLWSNAAGACVLTTAPSLDVTAPDGQQSLLGRDAILQITAATNDGYTLMYSARGLPPGLSIDPYGGGISGPRSPRRAPGTRPSR